LTYGHANGRLNARQAVLPEAEQVLIGDAPDKTRRGRIGGIALRVDGRRVGPRIARRGIAMRVFPKQQHFVKRRGNLLEDTAEGRDQQDVPIIRTIRGLMGSRWRWSMIGCSSPG
jgi:hypothetical protein